MNKQSMKLKRLLQECSGADLLNELERRTQAELDTPLMATLEVVKLVIADVVGVQAYSIPGTSRARRDVEARAIFIHILYQYLDMTLREVSKYVGARHHTSVIYLRNKVNDGLAGGVEPITMRVSTVLRKLVEMDIAILKSIEGLDE